MNINNAFGAKTPYVDLRRNSDPDPDCMKHERLDGKKVWPKVIDPATGRPATVIYRNDLNDVDPET